MKKLSFTHASGKTYHRVTRTAARNAYNAGRDVVMCPSNLVPFGMWQAGAFINKSDHPDGYNGGGVFKSMFDRLTCYFKAYNCTPEAGNAVYFYVAPIDKKDEQK